MSECPQKWVLAIPFFWMSSKWTCFFWILWASCGFIEFEFVNSDPIRCPQRWSGSVHRYINYTSTLPWHFDEQYQLFAFQGSSEHCKKKTTSGETCLPLTSLALKFRCLLYLSVSLARGHLESQLDHLDFFLSKKSTQNLPISFHRDVTKHPAELGYCGSSSLGYFIKTKDGALWPARRSPAYSSGRISFCITNSWPTAVGGSVHRKNHRGAGDPHVVRAPKWQPVSSYHKPWYTVSTAI